MKARLLSPKDITSEARINRKGQTEAQEGNWGFKLSQYLHWE